MPESNDTVRPEPRTDYDGAAVDIDFPGIRIGVAEYEEGPTGCTVIRFPRPATLAVDVRGGSPGTIGAHYPWADAICLAGGSAYGLEATAGVSAELLAERDYETEWSKIPLVAGAIIFDFGPRGNSIYPDKELGRVATRTAREGRFLVGPRGAGRSATVGKLLDFEGLEPAGQGAASRRVGETRVAVFTVVNAVGAIVDRQGNVVRGHIDTASGERRALVPALEQRLLVKAPPGNTTLTVLVTNRKLDLRSLTQLGRQVHASMARAIQPFHALGDGDVLFALTTDEIEDETLSSDALGVIASELAWDAVLTSFAES
jgi:6-aminohexanoate-oligomer endohydrolase